jgi:hypothetical protein
LGDRPSPLDAPRRRVGRWPHVALDLELPPAVGPGLVVGWLADELPAIVPALSTVTATLEWEEHARDLTL